jgi:hypothetical protein
LYKNCIAFKRYVCMYICVCVYIHTHTHTQREQEKHFLTKYGRKLLKFYKMVMQNLLYGSEDQNVGLPRNKFK